MCSLFIIVSFIVYFITTGIKLFFQLNSNPYLKVVARLLDFKPFNCIYCSALWLTIIICFILFHTNDLPSVKIMLITAFSSIGFTYSLFRLTGY